MTLGYTALGAVLMLIGLGVGAIVSPPLIAQRIGVFDEIHCSKLTVSTKYGKPVIVLGAGEEDGGGIVLFNPTWTQAAILHVDQVGGRLALHNAKGNPMIALSPNEEGSFVGLYNADKQRGIYLSTDQKRGRFIGIFNEKVSRGDLY